MADSIRQPRPDLRLAIELIAGRAADSGSLSEASRQFQTLSPTALAYLGDAVFELFVRTALLLPPKRLQTYHQQVVEQVRAERQVQHLDVLIPRLTPSELNVFKRGRNASPRGPRRLTPSIYQRATGFETLIGHLYLNDLPRLVELLEYVDLTVS
ncbi:ribonuclease III [filamentous cyanobacterium CCP5]|nr:ribonuclease III [filamentous cyanobacterium CCP5]